MSNNINKDSLQQALRKSVHSLKRMSTYAGVLFFLLIACVYGFVILQIDSLSNVTVDQQAVEEQVQNLSTPAIDERAAAQLLRLRDNSVNVQTLFEESRTNPFAE